MVKLFLITIFLNVVLVKYSGSSVGKHDGKASHHFHKHKYYEKIAHSKEAKDDIDYSENMVLADKVKGEAKTTMVTSGILSTFGHRSRTRRNLSTPKIEGLRVELEGSKISTTFPATRLGQDLAERVRKRVGGSQVMQGFKGEGQLEKSTPRPEKLSTVDRKRRVLENSMSANFGKSPEDSTQDTKKQMSLKATTNAQVIKTDQTNSKEKLSTRIGSIPTLFRNLPDHGATAKTNTPEQCCKNLGVSHMCLDFCTRDDDPEYIAVFGDMRRPVTEDCLKYEHLIDACWTNPDFKNEGEETSTESTTTESTTTESEENQPMENQMSQEITTLANDAKDDVDDTNTNLSPPLDVSMELNKIRTELDIISMLQREDRNYQTSINDIFEKLHRTSQEVYKDFTDALDEIKEIVNGHESNRQEHNFDETISSLETDVDHLKDDLETHNDPEYEISSEREYPISDMNDKKSSGRVLSGRVKRFVANGDESLEEESLKKHKETRSGQRNKNKASKQHSGDKIGNRNGNANEKDHGGRNFVSKDELKELENVVNEMRKSFSIKINGLNNQVDILRKQLKIGKKKTQKEMKAIKEIPSIKKEIDHEFSVSPPMTKSKSLDKHDAKPRVASGR